MERATSFEQLSDVLGLVTHTFCPIALKQKLSSLLCLLSTLSILVLYEADIYLDGML